MTRKFKKLTTLLLKKKYYKKKYLQIRKNI